MSHNKFCFEWIRDSSSDPLVLNDVYIVCIIERFNYLYNIGILFISLLFD